MKKSISILLSLMFLMGALSALQTPAAGGPTPRDIPHVAKVAEPSRNAPNFTFSRTPVTVMTSYYDYMIGSYNGLPVQVIPQSAGGGYFLTFHGKRTPTSTRRVYYAYLNGSGIVENFNEITFNNISEGYPSLAVDPVSGKPLYAWHANGDADAELEVQFTSDAFMFGLAGLFNDTVNIINNPTVISGTYMGNTFSSSDNEFIWPTLQIGPSPNPNMRRVYVLARNSVTHNTYIAPSENPYVAYADFNADHIEMGTPLVWSYTSIPEMNWWNHQTDWRRPFHAITTDNMGNVYYAGYHSATQSDGTTDIPEADLDVFVCPNYGQGTWSRVAEFSNLPSWNPPAQPGGIDGYFTDSDTGMSYTDDQLFWAIGNSSHLNAVCDSQGRVHVMGIWSLQNSEGSYYPSFQTVKSFIYDPSDQSFTINEIFPQNDPENSFSDYYQPWDTEAPFGVPDSYTSIDGEYYLDIESTWPFPHYDSDLHDNAMFFHYNNLKITTPNEQGMMVAVWQDSKRASLGVQYPQDYPEMVPYASGAEIMISVSSNNGNSWSEPIRLNAVDTPQLTNMKPMWVYPANKVIYTGESISGNMMGKIGMMFYNDYTWGSNAISPPAHPANDGGQVVFTELEIEFGPSNPIPEDPFDEPMVLSGSMTLMAGVRINNQNAEAGDIVAAFVNTNGIPQLRGKETVSINEDVPGCLMQIYTESNGESIYFMVWDASTNQIHNVSETLISEVNGTVGSWPDNLYWLNAGAGGQQFLLLNNGWNMVSLNVHPLSTDIPTALAMIMPNIQTIKTPDGVFQPGNPYSTLTTLQDGKGYNVKVNSQCSITISGNPLDAATPIPLSAGWNLVAFTPQAPLPIQTAISSLSGYLVQVKGAEGTYIPGNPYNTLSSMSPGRAYWIKLTSATDLIYPPQTRTVTMAQPLPVDGEGPVLKSDSQTVLIGFDSSVKAGDIINAWVGEELRGSNEIIIVDGKAGALVQIFSEIPGEKVEFRLTRQNGGNILNMNPALSTEPGSILGDYAANQFYELYSDHTDTPELVTGLGKAYPNPFKQGTNIEVTIAKETPDIQINIYNVKGQKVKSLAKGELKPGTQNLWWDGTDSNGKLMPSGVYFCRLQSGKTQQNIKLMLLK